MSGTCEVKLEPEETSVCAASGMLIAQSSSSENKVSRGCESELKIKCEVEECTEVKSTAFDESYSAVHCVDLPDHLIDSNRLILQSDVKQEVFMETSSTGIPHLSCDLDNGDASSFLTQGSLKEEMYNQSHDLLVLKEEGTKLHCIPTIRKCSVVLQRLDITSLISGVTGLGKRRPSTLNKSVPARHNKSSQREKTFSRIDQVKPNIQCKHSSDGQFYCSHCNDAFSTAGHLKVHIWHKHMNSRPYCCTQCDKSFCLEFELTRHIKRVHEDKKYKCDRCDFSTNYNHCLKLHISAIHLEEKPHQCPQCHSSFTQKCHLMQHTISVHNYNLKKLYQCSSCDEKFVTRQHRDEHRRSVHCEEGYSCDQCDYKCMGKGYLEYHQRTKHNRSRMKVYPCTMCDYKSSVESDVKKHCLAVHNCLNGELHSCNECDKAFQFASGLKQHVDTEHRGLRHICIECGKTFSSKNGLEYHIKYVRCKERPPLCLSATSVSPP